MSVYMLDHNQYLFQYFLKTNIQSNKVYYVIFYPYQRDVILKYRYFISHLGLPAVIDLTIPHWFIVTLLYLITLHMSLGRYNLNNMYTFRSQLQYHTEVILLPTFIIILVVRQQQNKFIGIAAIP